MAVTDTCWPLRCVSSVAGLALRAGQSLLPDILVTMLWSHATYWSLFNPVRLVQVQPKQSVLEKAGRKLVRKEWWGILRP